MEPQRRHFCSEDKVKILREHLIDQVAISQVCEKHQIQPTLFYAWQKIFFENGTAAFERPPSHSRVSLEQKKIAQLEEKLQRKDEDRRTGKNAGLCSMKRRELPKKKQKVKTPGPNLRRPKPTDKDKARVIAPLPSAWER